MCASLFTIMWNLSYFLLLYLFRLFFSKFTTVHEQTHAKLAQQTLALTIHHNVWWNVFFWTWLSLILGYLVMLFYKFSGSRCVCVYFLLSLSLSLSLSHRHFSYSHFVFFEIIFILSNIDHAQIFRFASPVQIITCLFKCVVFCFLPLSRLMEETPTSMRDNDFCAENRNKTVFLLSSKLIFFFVLRIHNIVYKRIWRWTRISRSRKSLECLCHGHFSKTRKKKH